MWTFFCTSPTWTCGRVSASWGLRPASLAHGPLGVSSGPACGGRPAPCSSPPHPVLSTLSSYSSLAVFWCYFWNILFLHLSSNCQAGGIVCYGISYRIKSCLIISVITQTFVNIIRANTELFLEAFKPLKLVFKGTYSLLWVLTSETNTVHFHLGTVLQWVNFSGILLIKHKMILYCVRPLFS